MSAEGATLRAWAEAVRTQTVTAGDGVERSLQAIAATAELGAWLHVDADGARAQAEHIDARARAGVPLGALAGVPVAIKNNIAVAGWPLTCGSRMLATYVAAEDAEVVRRLRAADAILVGTTALDEFAMGSSGERCAFGITRNPWDAARVPGGSSSGSAAAVASGAVPLALGSDTGGSIRQPGSYCGLVGLKPTWGRVSRRGLVAFASSLDAVGPLTRRVADAAWALQVLAGPDPGDATTSAPVEAFVAGTDPMRRLEGLRVGIPAAWFERGLEPDTRAALTRTRALLQERGVVEVPVELPHADYALATYQVVACAEASSNLARFDGVRYGHRAAADEVGALMARSRSEGLGVEVQRRILLGAFALSAGAWDAWFGQAQRVRTCIAQDFVAAFAQCDVLLGPTTAGPAFGLGDRLDDAVAMYDSDAFTIAANLAGLPAVSIPAGLGDDGLPRAVQLHAPLWGERQMLDVAAALERGLPVLPRAPLAAVEGWP